MVRTDAMLKNALLAFAAIYIVLALCAAIVSACLFGLAAYRRVEEASVQGARPKAMA